MTTANVTSNTRTPATPTAIATARMLESSSSIPDGESIVGPKEICVRLIFLDLVGNDAIYS